MTVSGAHLYGFPSPDSDIDLRGSHLLPLREVVGLSPPAGETIERKFDLAGTEVELVSHDPGKYLGLLVKNNGYVLEQIFSPLVVTGDDFLSELRLLARQCITRHHYHHYRASGRQCAMLNKQQPKVGRRCSTPTRRAERDRFASHRGGRGEPAASRRARTARRSSRS